MIKLADRFKAIEQFVLEHKPPMELRTHLHLLTEHLEMEDSLLDQIAKKDASHAKVIATMSAEKAKVDEELAEMKAQKAKAEDDYLEAAQKKHRENVKKRTLHYE